MIDRVKAICSECASEFEVWLSRGEIAPALCLGCWFRRPAVSSPAVSQAQDSRASDSPLADQVITPVQDGTRSGPSRR